jgi:hypothetical protein
MDLYLEIMWQESVLLETLFFNNVFQIVLLYTFRGERTILWRKTPYIAKLYFCDYRWEESTKNSASVWMLEQSMFLE